MNHAGKSRELSVGYNHDGTRVLDMWTVRDIKAREEMNTLMIMRFSSDRGFR